MEREKKKGQKRDCQGRQASARELRRKKQNVKLTHKQENRVVSCVVLSKMRFRGREDRVFSVAEFPCFFFFFFFPHT